MTAVNQKSALISIIVPVYNTKAYLDRCVNSLLQQSLKQIEIILVDDGSNDGSAELCDDFARRDGRVQVIHQQNHGLSGARNSGIKAARADYLMFVDSDDWAEPQFCEVPYRTAMETKADLVMFSYWLIQNTDRKKKEGQTPEGIVSKEEAMLLLEEMYIGPMTWNKLYHRNLFKDIQFPEGRVHEDEGTTYRLIHAANRICCLNEHLYNYVEHRPGGIMSRTDKQKLHDKQDMLLQRAEDLLAWGYDYQAKADMRRFSYLIRMGRHQRRSEECDRAVMQIKGYPPYFTRKLNGMLFLYRHFPAVFDFVCRMTGRREI